MDKRDRKDRNDQIVRLVLGGRSQREVAKQFGLSPLTVNGVMRDRGLTRGVEEMPDRNQEIARRMANGESGASLGREYGISRERARAIGARYGVSVPKPGPLFRVCEVCGDRKRVTGKAAAASRWCARCRPSPKLRCPPITLECSKCGSEFMLDGRRRTQLLQNQRQRGFVGAWCHRCREARHRGPLAVTCAACGDEFEVTGQRKSDYLHRWSISRTQPNVYCLGCHPITSRGPRLSRT